MSCKIRYCAVQGWARFSGGKFSRRNFPFFPKALKWKFPHVLHYPEGSLLRLPTKPPISACVALPRRIPASAAHQAARPFPPALNRLSCSLPGVPSPDPPSQHSPPRGGGIGVPAGPPPSGRNVFPEKTSTKSWAVFFCGENVDDYEKAVQRC